MYREGTGGEVVVAFSYSNAIGYLFRLLHARPRDKIYVRNLKVVCVCVFVIFTSCLFDFAS